MRDVKLMYLRSLKNAIRTPIFIFVNLFQPLLYLVLFMPLLKNLGGLPGLPEGKTVEIFIPGLLVMMAIFGSAFVGFGLIDEIRSGVIERFLVTPIGRFAILLGRVLRDTTVVVIQCLIIAAAAMPFGLAIHFGGFLLSLFLYVLISIVMSSLSYGFALIYKDENGLAPTINMITLPVMLLSGIFLPLALAPLWLQNLSKFNPFSYAVNAARALFMGNFQSLDIICGFFILTALAVAVFMWTLKILKKMAS